MNGAEAMDIETMDMVEAMAMAMNGDETIDMVEVMDTLWAMNGAAEAMDIEIMDKVEAMNTIKTIDRVETMDMMETIDTGCMVDTRDTKIIMTFKIMSLFTSQNFQGIDLIIDKILH
eukprot:GHVR01152148.1.p2 GENE.GHVR01152148.1~~GHVR01152148.1.p2  ORF type:complete len:117 (+),score=18.67 GHVR01152148.1:145-495(+)